MIFSLGLKQTLLIQYLFHHPHKLQGYISLPLPSSYTLSITVELVKAGGHPEPTGSSEMSKMSTDVRINLGKIFKSVLLVLC